MKKIIKLLVLFVLTSIIGTGCSDDSAGGGITDPFGTGGGTGNNNNNTGTVTFTIGTTPGTQGGIIFTATPSVSVKITKVIVSLPSQQYVDTLTDDGVTVFQGNQTFMIQEYIGVASGQKWTFQFEGTLASNNQAFNVTSNYTVP